MNIATMALAMLLSIFYATDVLAAGVERRSLDSGVRTPGETYRPEPPTFDDFDRPILGGSGGGSGDDILGTPEFHCHKHKEPVCGIRYNQFRHEDQYTCWEEEHMVCVPE
jgi:hypothetical protein